MTIRRMRAADRPGIVEVYEARTRTSAGLMRRAASYWRHRWPRKKSKDIWLVATDRGRIAGFAAGSFDPDSAWALEAYWHPEHDGTDLGRRLVRHLLSRIGKEDPIGVVASVVDGSPALPLWASLVGHARPPGSLFMAGVVDPKALLRDAARVVERRIADRIRLRAGRHEVVTKGRGRTAAIVSFDPPALLGILLGIRRLSTELRRRTAVLRPRNPRTLRLLREAFPERPFFIQDAW